MDNVLIIDSNNIMFRIFTTTDVTQSKLQIFKEFAGRYARVILDFNNKFNPTHIFIMKEGGNLFRKKLSPIYKDGRNKAAADKGNREMRDFYPRYEKMLDAIEKFTSINVLQIPGLEADDLVSIPIYKGKYNVKFILASYDKDFQQLYMYNKNFEQYKTNMEMYQNVDYQLLKHLIIGDKADNIPGIKRGVGEKTAEKIIAKGELDILLSDDKVRQQFELNKLLIDVKNIPHIYMDMACKEFDDRIENGKKIKYNETDIYFGLNRMGLESLRGI